MRDRMKRLFARPPVTLQNQSGNSLADHCERTLCGKTIQEVRNADLEAFGKHHDLCVVQPAHTRFDFRKRATGHVPASRLAAGRKLLLSEAVSHPQFAYAATRKIEISSCHCSVFGA